jgi:hypothetical protein
MPTTSNFGWTTPADTDLVKDGAAAIRTLGNGIDTSLLDLKGGTTDQVLAKNSNTDLDFKWVSDATGIQATIFDAKGDLIAASAADTAARLASSGVNGDVLTVATGETTGLKWAAPVTGSMTQLATGSFSGTNLELSGISTDYKDLRLVIQDWYMSTDNNLFIQLNNVTSGSYQNMFIRTGDTTVTTDLGNSSGYIGVAENDNSDKNSFAMLEIFDYANTNTHKLCVGYGYSVNGSNVQKVGFSMSAMTSGTAAVTEIDIFGSGSPTLTQGTYFLYGVK